MDDKDLAMSIINDTIRTLIFETNNYEYTSLDENEKNNYYEVRRIFNNCIPFFETKIEEIGYLAVTKSWVLEVLRENIIKNNLKIIPEIALPTKLQELVCS